MERFLGFLTQGIVVEVTVYSSRIGELCLQATCNVYI